MRESSGSGRPLDPGEQRDFDAIVAGWHDLPRTRHGEPALRVRHVLMVLAASAVLLVATTTLPHPLDLWSPPGLLLVVAAVALYRGLRRG